MPVIDGSRAKVKIPAGTQTGEQFRLRGKGFSVLRSAARGDMYIQVAVETPQHLTRRQRELLEEFETEAEHHSQGQPGERGLLRQGEGVLRRHARLTASSETGRPAGSLGAGNSPPRRPLARERVAETRVNLQQIEALCIVAAMLALFVTDRIRYDVVAALTLCAAALIGVVPPHKAFEGFSNPVIIIIASVLVLSRAVAVSGIIEQAMRRVMRRISSTSLQVGVLAGAVTLLSALMKNVGALGIFMPIAIQTAERGENPCRGS